MHLKQKKFTLFFLAMFFNSLLLAGENQIYTIIPKDKFINQKEKNGITLEQVLKNFNSKFKFISSHFREDKFEIRLIYGNKLAMEGLKFPKNKYKDGAIFYKAVFQTQHDPNFEASLIPESQPIVRQVMLYNAKKFKKTNGWGFAVFTENGETLPGDPDATLDTCYACHQIVENRNNVFSVPMETITPNTKIKTTHYSKEYLLQAKTISDQLFHFKIEDISNVDADISSILLKNSKQVNNLDGSMIKMEFAGFMTELSSFLIKETRKNNLPSLAVKSFNNQLIYNFAFKDFEATECKKDETLIRFGWGKKADNFEKNTLVTMKKCYSNLENLQ